MDKDIQSSEDIQGSKFKVQDSEVFSPYGKYRFSALPNCVLKFKGLSPMAKLCLQRMYQYGGKDTYCYPSMETLAEDIGLSTQSRHINRIIAELEKKGFILKEKVGRHNRYYFLLHDVFKEEDLKKAEGIEDIQSSKFKAEGVQQNTREYKNKIENIRQTCVQQYTQNQQNVQTRVSQNTQRHKNKSKNIRHKSKNIVSSLSSLPRKEKYTAKVSSSPFNSCTRKERLETRDKNKFLSQNYSDINKKSFGTFLREQRLKVGYGLRDFAEAIEMQPSILSNIEHNRMPPPQDKNILTRIAEIIGIKEKSKEWSLLFNLAVEERHKGAKAEGRREEKDKKFTLKFEDFFTRFWNLYPKRNKRKTGKKQTKEWLAKYLAEKYYDSLLQATQNYAESTLAINNYARDPIRFVRNDYWRDWVESEEDEFDNELNEVAKEVLREYIAQGDRFVPSYGKKASEALQDILKEEKDRRYSRFKVQDKNIQSSEDIQGSRFKVQGQGAML